MTRVLREVHKLSSTQVRQLVEAEAARRGVKVPAGTFNRLLAAENLETGRISVAEALPMAGERQIAGRIIQQNVQVNFYKRLKYPENHFSRAFLGKLVAESHVELIIREDPDPKTRFCAQVTGYFPLALYNKGHFRIGSSVIAYLVPHQMPNGSEIWSIDNLEHSG